jgi:hypothetical protein
MDVKTANAIPLSEILHKLNHRPIRQKGHEIWYISPFRNEKNASFHINTSGNVWYDFGEMQGGNVIQFVTEWLKSRGEDHTVRDALRWLRNMFAGSTFTLTIPVRDLQPEPSALNLVRLDPLENPGFADYLIQRAIPLRIARRYLKEATIANAKTGKRFRALAMKNENGGFELRNKFFKGSIAPKDITFVRGSVLMPKEIHVFEGMMDFLSLLSFWKLPRLEGDAIILNSVGKLEAALPYIRDYSYETVYSWLDNDLAGHKCTQVLKSFVAEQRNLVLKPMNHIYAPFKDVNDWLVKGAIAHG